jgi:dihydrolipoamide dehydrogenase
MSEPIIMPQIGQDITTGKVVEWFKKESEPIEKGDIVCSVEGEKGIFEVEAEASGVLLKIIHQAGEEVEVFKPIGHIGQPGEEV